MRRLLVAILVTLPAMAAAQQAGWGNLGKKQAEVFTWSKWWTEPLFGGFWMAWTRATLAFFLFVFAAITILALVEWRRPGGDERTGVLGLATTRATGCSSGSWARPISSWAGSG